ncbi:MAG: hypothetical protein HUJ98_10500, partial [Bacteroidaceae bacterium]|nr:hypothetical protein [Bacteroidaceae bacterium]
SSNILFVCAVWLIAGAVSSQELKVKSFSQDFADISAQKYRVNDANEEPCALLKVSFAEPEAQFEGDFVKAEYKTGEYWVYLTDGATYLNIKSDKYAALRYEFPEPVKKLSTYILVIQKVDGLTFSKHNQFYVDVFFQAGALMGFGATVGAHFHAVNAEIEINKGIGKSDEVFWYDQNKLIAKASYSTLSGNVKLGYGFQLHKKIFLTPQVGFGLVKCLSDDDNPGKNANAAFALVGCRGSFVFAKHLQVFVAPYYNFAVKKSGSFEEIAGVHSSINNWASGFNVKVGLSLFF